MDLLRPTHFKRMLFFIVTDIMLSVLTLFIAFLLRFNFDFPREFLDGFLLAVAILLPIKIGTFFILKIYHVAWRFFSLQDALNLLKAHLLIYTIFTTLFLVIVEVPFPRSVILIDFVLSYLFISSIRISKRVMIEKSPKSINKAIIIGANAKAANIIKSSLNQDIDYYVVSIFEDDKNLIGTYFSDIKVHPLSRLKELIEQESVKTALIAKEYEPDELDTIFEALNLFGVNEIKLIKFFEDEKIKDISIEDLLARKPKDLDREKIAQFVKEKRVLITGAGGSIGSEICRQLQTFGAKELILVDNSEFNLYKIGEEITIPKRLKLISILDQKRVALLFEESKPEIVIHAAAYKHVPLCEENIDAAIENNIFGSKNVIDLSIAHGVEKIVIVSTDKAVRPTNIMGATKRVVELYAQNIDPKNSEIVSVRFGNVLGSSGSVVPKFRSQIESNQNITVTHPEIRRYFMLIPEACQLVLQASSLARGGEIFILDMGEPVKIVDLAKKMLKLYKKEHELTIEFIGLRPGEKLYEELLIDESEKKTEYESIHVAKSTHFAIEELLARFEELKDERLKKEEILRKIVPEFQRVEITT